MKTLKKLALLLVVGLALLVLALNIWGALTLGSLSPAANAAVDEHANQVVMVFGATGSVGDGLLKAAVADPNVEKVYVVTRRSSPRIEDGVAYRLRRPGGYLGRGEYRAVGSRHHLSGYG
jgi:methionine-rich copper-binding protein CopC